MCQRKPVIASRVAAYDAALHLPRPMLQVGLHARVTVGVLRPKLGRVMAGEPPAPRSPPSSRRLVASTPTSSPTSGARARGTGRVPGLDPLILVVDDFDDNRELYASTLAEAGYSVEQATNGQEALDRIGQTRPAIIIMDLSMPVLDGWETTRRIKADPRTADIVIIAVTGHATNYGLLQAKEAGAEAVLTKPCLPADLLALIGVLMPS
jgi:CheY-like chemotaxis protein